MPVDNRPLPGSGKRKRDSVVTPDAAVATDETPVVGVVMTLDFTFKNPWLARVTQGFSRENIVDLAMSTQTAYSNAKSAGVLLPAIPGGYAAMTLDNFDSVVQMLDDLAEFGKWDHSGDKPDLPDSYADAPALRNGMATLACAIERLEIAHNAKLPAKAKKRIVLVSGIFNKLGGKPKDFDQLSLDVLRALMQHHRFWMSDSGSVTPFRLEFFLRSKGVTLDRIQSILSRWKDFFKDVEGTVGKAAWIIEKAFEEIMKEANVAAEKAKRDAAVAAQKLLVSAGAPSSTAKGRATLVLPKDKEEGKTDGAGDDARSVVSVAGSVRSVVSVAESVRSQLTDKSVRSVLSGMESASSVRSAVSVVSEAMSTKAICGNR